MVIYTRSTSKVRTTVSISSPKLYFSRPSSQSSSNVPTRGAGSSALAGMSPKVSSVCLSSCHPNLMQILDGDEEYVVLAHPPPAAPLSGTTLSMVRSRRDASLVAHRRTASGTIESDESDDWALSGPPEDVVPCTSPVARRTPSASPPITREIHEELPDMYDRNHSTFSRSSDPPLHGTSSDVHDVSVYDEEFEDELEEEIAPVSETKAVTPPTRNVSSLLCHTKRIKKPSQHIPASTLPNVPSSVKFLKREVIGRGTSGTVYKVEVGSEWVISNSPCRDKGVSGLSADTTAFAFPVNTVVMKEITVMTHMDNNTPNLTTCTNEIRLLGSVQHTNIVQLYGYRKTSTTVELFMEYISGGSLRGFTYHNGPSTEAMIQSFVRQIVHGLHYLHARNILHRDLKCDNILVTPEGTIKLADFGTARFAPSHHAQSVVGTANYMAPELIRGDSYDDRVDIWSLGCSIVELAVGTAPFSNFPNAYAAMFHVVALTSTAHLIPCTFSKNGREFLKLCLAVDPVKRARAKDLAMHPWIFP